MPYRNIFVANETKMKLRSNQLIVDNGEELSFPIEDIRSIVIDNQYATFSAKLLSKLADCGVCVILCDEKHSPSSQLMPIGTYCRVNKRITLQFEQSKPKLKRIWREIVEKKISNQAMCLKVNSIDKAKELFDISKTVTSGDSTNREGYAARIYFKALFGESFNRKSENGINAALNYGYSVFRSYIAKTLVAYGLEPSLGIYHKNQLNAFNLADDVIEPFRPIVDNYVYKHSLEWGSGFFTAQKAELVLLLNSAVLIDGQRHSVANAMEQVIQSVISSFENDDIDLKLPSFEDVSYFEYD